MLLINITSIVAATQPQKSISIPEHRVIKKIKDPRKTLSCAGKSMVLPSIILIQLVFFLKKGGESELNVGANVPEGYLLYCLIN